VRRSASVVAIALAIALGLAVNVVTFAVLYDAIRSPDEGVSLTENATQLLTTAFGGIIGVLGSYIGFRAANGGGGDG